MNIKMIKNTAIAGIWFIATTTICMADSLVGGNVTDKVDNSFIVIENNDEGGIEKAFDDNSKQIDKAATVAELRLKTGTTIRFVKEGTSVEGERRVGIIEVTAAKVEPVLSALVKEHQPTPLEVFLALASPDTKPPVELLRDHERVASARDNIGQKPRKLKLPETTEATNAYDRAYPVAGTLEMAGTEVSSCAFDIPESLHFDFILDASDALGAGLDNHGHGHNLNSTHYGVTGFSSRRALGTCNDSGFAKSVRISYEWIEGVWVDEFVQDDLIEAWLFPGSKFFYYSDSWPLILRYRIRVGFTINGSDGNIAHTEGSW